MQLVRLLPKTTYKILIRDLDPKIIFGNMKDKAVSQYYPAMKPQNNINLMTKQRLQRYSTR